MATIYMNASGGGVFSSDLTATKADVLATKTAITSDSNDSAAQGTLPLTAVKTTGGGTMQINGLTTFSAAQSNTTPNTVVFTTSITAQTGKYWGGYYVRFKEGSYPTSITDGTECGYYSQSGGTYTHTSVEATRTFYYRAWDFCRYSETVTSPQTYPLIEWGTYHNAKCTIASHPTPYILTYAGSLTANTTGSLTIPAGYTHADVAVVAVGGYSGTAYSKWRGWGTDEKPKEECYNYGRSGGEGGQVRVLSLTCSKGQSMSWSIGKAGTAGSATYTSGTNYSQYSTPFTQGSAGTSTTFTFNGTTYTCVAGNNGTSAYSGGAGGTGRAGADGGAAGSTTIRSTGGNGTQGTYFTPTQTYYGGGGCGVGTSYKYSDWYEGAHTKQAGVEGTHGVTDDAYGHGGNALQSYSCSQCLTAPQVGAIIISLT